MKKQNKNSKLFFLAALLAFAPALAIFSSQATVTATNYSPYCTSPTCRAAADREAAAQAKADELSAVANTLEGEVELLNAEIESLEAEIATNQAIANDLASQIAANQAKLADQQNALASLLVEMHFNSTPNTIMILASSESISDFAEKQSRQETVKAEITASAKAVKEIKEKLDQQKAGVDAILATQNTKRSEIADKRNRQSSLMANYKHNANAYAADAEAARKIKAKEINDAIRAAEAQHGGSVISGAGGNTYPYQNQCPGANLAFLAYGGYVCQCTSYAGWKAYETYGVRISSWGNASNWGNSAIAHGYRVDNHPAPGTVAYSTAGAYGHVMWVESVNGNTITLSEYNYVYGDFSRRSGVSASAYRYIHFN